MLSGARRKDEQMTHQTDTDREYPVAWRCAIVVAALLLAVNVAAIGLFVFGSAEPRIVQLTSIDPEMTTTIEKSGPSATSTKRDREGYPSPPSIDRSSVPPENGYALKGPAFDI